MDCFLRFTEPLPLQGVCKMLVLSRKVGERLVIGDDIVVIINKIAGNRVTIAIEAPNDVRIVRGELSPLPQAADFESDETSQLASGTDAIRSRSQSPVANRLGFVASRAS
jgi:carbon storage regulator